eukprot:ANDGO_07164.mRNA.1 hypothetical protein
MSRRSAHDSSQVASFLNPANGLRGEMERKGIKPKDHAAENVKKLRDAQEANRTKRTEALEARDPVAEFKLSKFKNVESVVSKSLREQREHQHDATLSASSVGVNNENTNNMHHSGNGSSSNDTNNSSGYLKAHTLEDRSQKMLVEKKASVPLDLRVRSKVKPSLPDFSRNPLSLHDGGADDGDESSKKKKDFISTNAVSVIQSKKFDGPQPRKEKEKDALALGKVPEYLVARKAEMAEKKMEEMKRKEEEARPKGLTLLSEDERVATLQNLVRSKEDIIAELHRLPFSDTMRVVKKRTELDQKIGEIEAAILIFSREKVYIQE